MFKEGFGPGAHDGEGIQAGDSFIILFCFILDLSHLVGGFSRGMDVERRLWALFIMLGKNMLP